MIPFGNGNRLIKGYVVSIGDQCQFDPEKIKEIVGAPEEYEFTCLLTMGYPAENAFLPKQKVIDVESRIHIGIW